jgi:hypothetical protein
MKRLSTTLLAAAALAAVSAAPASAQAPALPKNPVKACAALAQLDPEFYGFIATKPGACQSTLAAVGVDGLLGGAFPSNAAAIGNCKNLEQTTFPAYTPEDGRAYPYLFYWDLRQLLDILGLQEAAAYYDSIRSQLVARNRAECVQVLRRVHGGLMNPVFEALPPGP